MFEKCNWLAQIHWLLLWLCLLSFGVVAYADVSPLASTDQQVQLVDETDLISNVLKLAGARLDLMPAVAAAKWPTHASISDPTREAIVIQAARDRVYLSISVVFDRYVYYLFIIRHKKGSIATHFGGTSTCKASLVPD